MTEKEIKEFTKKELAEAFERADAQQCEYHNRLIIMLMQESICELVKGCSDKWILEIIAKFCGGMVGKHFACINVDHVCFEKQEDSAV